MEAISGLKEAISGLKEANRGLKEAGKGLKEADKGLKEAGKGLKEVDRGLKEFFHRKRAEIRRTVGGFPIALSSITMRIFLQCQTTKWGYRI